MIKNYLNLFASSVNLIFFKAAQTVTFLSKNNYFVFTVNYLHLWSGFWSWARSVKWVFADRDTRNEVDETLKLQFVKP